MTSKLEIARLLIEQAGNAAHWTPLLHIHIEDLNLEDWWFDRNDSSFRKADYESAEQWERAIFDALAICTEDERYQAVTGDPFPAMAYHMGDV